MTTWRIRRGIAALGACAVWLSACVSATPPPTLGPSSTGSPPGPSSSPSSSTVPAGAAVTAGPASAGPASAAPATNPLAGMPGWLVYQVRAASGPQIELHLMRTDGTDDHAIATDVPATDATGPQDHDHPEWSGDGSTLVFARERPSAERRGLFAFDLASGTSRELVRCDDPCVDATEAALSPDATSLAYFFAEGDIDADGIPADCGLRILTLGSGATRDVAVGPCGLVEYRFPDWSPDGAKLVFLRTRQDVRGGALVSTELVVRDLASDDETIVAAPGLDADELDWSPDGATIGVVTARRLDLYDVATGERRTLVDLDTAETGFDTQADVIRHPRFTPDGSMILFGIYQTDSAGTAVRRDLWAVSPDGGSIAEVFPHGTPGNERGFYTRASLQAAP